MLTHREGGLVLLLLSLSLLLPQPSGGQGQDQGQGQGQSQDQGQVSLPEFNCSCNLTNSRCDEAGVCRCDPGWAGPRCEACVPTPGCVHGSCHQPWQCSCLPGWGGRFCDKDVQVCWREEPCRNGATCMMEESGDYTCLCPHGYQGRHCQLKTGPCSQRRSPCRNGGQCEDDGGYANALRCRCLAGYGGPRCEVDLDDCAMRPCGGGATCVDGVNRFSCLCPPGFSGRFCSLNTDECADRPCLNGGRCLDGAGTFRCVCPPGFTGPACQEARGREEARDPLLFKVSVREVGAQGGGLSQAQVLLVGVLGALTLAVVLITAGVVLRGRCQNRDQGPRHRPPPPSARHREESGLSLATAMPEQSRGAVEEQECKISFLDPPTGTEPEKKRLNSAVI
ncbi:protein delta homolog 2 [Gadus chalcogrammus]|uniref:protein delta homolog 2 n=1 Tax=Gadus chalcogrammus TaxID=1042646 RepID=UPI0024C49BA4|nr:protein delta homolog 2 [Gadus chalcogrammus]